MTPEKVIEALENEIHLVEWADGLYAENISLELLKSVRDLINRLQAENERLKYQVNRLKNYDERRDIDLHSRLIAKAKSEAVKEFAEKLNDRIINFPSAYPIENATLAFLNGSSHRQLEILEIVDNLVKEMVGET